MNNILKKAFAAISVLSLTATMGLAAACDPEGTPNPPAHTHEYTEWGHDDEQHWKYCPDDNEKDASTVANHNFATEDYTCECGLPRAKTVVIGTGTTGGLTVDGKTKVTFVKEVGTYKLTVNNIGNRSYTFKIGENEYTVNSEHSEFKFNVNIGSTVNVYNPDSTVSKVTEGSGVEMTITPAADYAQGETKDSISVTVESLSTVLVNGNNQLTITEAAVHKYMINSSGGNFGTYTFKFDITNDDEYEITAAGKTETVNKTNKEVTFDFQRSSAVDPDEPDEEERDANAGDVVVGGGSHTYLISFTPKAGNSGEPLNCYIVQPLKERVCDFGEAYGININSAHNPELVDIYNGEVEVKVNIGLNAGPYALVGNAYYSGFGVYVGADKVGELTGVDASGESEAEVNVILSLEDKHIVEGVVTLKFVFDCEESQRIHFIGTVSQPLEEVDNSKLVLVSDRVESLDVTTCLEKDKNDDGQYVYTFTAPHAGWFEVNMLGNSGVKYTVGTESGTLLGYDWKVTKPFELSQDETVTVTLENSDSNASPVGTSIAVMETEEPAEPITELSLGSNSIDLTEAQITDGGIQLVFNGAPGTYNLYLSGSGWENAVVLANGTFVAGFDPDDMSQFDPIASGTFTVTDSAVTFTLSGLMQQDSSYIVTIESTSLVVGANSIVLTEEQIVDGGKQFTFTGAPGTYNIVLSGPDWENAVVLADGTFVAGFDPNNWDQWDAIASGTFTVTDSAVTITLSGLMQQDSSYTVTITAA